MQLLNEALLVGASQGFLLCIVILSLPSANPAANRLLVLYVGLEALHLFFLHLVYIDATASPPLVLRLLFGMRALGGPALYLYSRALTEPSFRLEPRQCGHLWVLGFLLTWFAVLVVDPSWRTQSTAALQDLPSTVAMSLYQSLVVAGYALVAWRLLNAHQRRLRQALSVEDTVNLAWLRWLMVAVVGVNLLHLSLDLLRALDLVGADAKLVINLIMTLTVIYLISIGGLRQPKIFTEPVRAALAAFEKPPEIDGAAAIDANGRGKYLKSGLDENRRQEIWQQLRQLLDVERPFLSATLDLPKLARRLGVRPHELSEVINTLHGGSFYDLINHYRVEAAKALLQEPAERHRKMLDIALSVGFSSQSTFYNQFKKQTGMTPTAYREGCTQSLTSDPPPPPPLHLPFPVRR